MLLIENKVQSVVVSRINYQGYIKSSLVGGVSLYTGKNLKQMREEEPEEDYEEISYDELYEKYTKPYLDSLQKPWNEITEDYWWEMLECLPPLRWRDISIGVNCFAISEAYTCSLHSHFLKVNINGEKKYYSALRSIYDSDEKILKDFKKQLLCDNIQ